MPQSHRDAICESEAESEREEKRKRRRGDQAGLVLESCDYRVWLGLRCLLRRGVCRIGGWAKGAREARRVKGFLRFRFRVHASRIMPGSRYVEGSQTPA